MKTKQINWIEEFSKLFPESCERKLSENQEWCEHCNGLGWKRNGDFLTNCPVCGGSGKINLCANGCKTKVRRGYTICDSCYDKEQKEKLNNCEKENYEKAKKIKFKDYDGMLMSLSIGERVVDKEEFEEELYDRLLDDDCPNYVYGTTKYCNISVNIFDIIEDKCTDDGYDDQFEQLNTSGLQDIQNAIDEWIKAQGDSVYVYSENGVVVELDELIEELKCEIQLKKIREMRELENENKI